LDPVPVDQALDAFMLEAVSECTISAVTPAPGAKLMIAGSGA
jgi:hypothetical protein